MKLLSVGKVGWLVGAYGGCFMSYSRADNVASGRPPIRAPAVLHLPVLLVPQYKQPG